MPGAIVTDPEESAGEGSKMSMLGHISLLWASILSKFLNTEGNLIPGRLWESLSEAGSSKRKAVLASLRVSSFLGLRSLLRLRPALTCLLLQSLAADTLSSSVQDSILVSDKPAIVLASVQTSEEMHMQVLVRKLRFSFFRGTFVSVLLLRTPACSSGKRCELGLCSCSQHSEFVYVRSGYGFTLVRAISKLC